jgi:FkbM family methyltransferase
MLRSRFAGDAQVSVHDNAIGGNIGNADFHITSDTVSSSLLQSTGENSEGRQEIASVSVTTLDHWIEGRDIRRPALLKLDIEGSELAALRSGQNLLKNIDFVEMETTFVNARIGQPAFKELLDFMDEQGFELFDVYPGILDKHTGRANWADVLFARKGFPA